MKARHQARIWAVQFLFQCDFNSTKVDEGLVDFWTDKKPSAKALSFTEQLIYGVVEHREALDEKLQQYADNWDVHRMAAVDRNVMRLALYEMFYCDDVPPIVAINEAVDMAKELSSLKSGNFVNGILDRAQKDVDRPARGTE